MDHFYCLFSGKMCPFDILIDDFPPCGVDQVLLVHVEIHAFVKFIFIHRNSYVFWWESTIKWIQFCAKSRSLVDLL